MNGPVDIGEHITAICAALGLSKNYVTRLDIGPEVAWIDLLKGRDGPCEGGPYAIDANGDPCYESGLTRVAAASETLAFEIRT